MYTSVVDKVKSVVWLMILSILHYRAATYFYLHLLAFTSLFRLTVDDCYYAPPSEMINVNGFWNLDLTATIAICFASTQSFSLPLETKSAVVVSNRSTIYSQWKWNGWMWESAMIAPIHPRLMILMMMMSRTNGAQQWMSNSHSSGFNSLDGLNRLMCLLCFLLLRVA